MQRSLPNIQTPKDSTKFSNTSNQISIQQAKPQVLNKITMSLSKDEFTLRFLEYILENSILG